MKIEIWSDIACPWCYVGKRRMESALAKFAHKDDVEITWRSFQLDPSAPAKVDESMEEHLAKKYGMSVAQARASGEQLTATGAAEGLDIHFEKMQLANTFDAHRLIHFAAASGLGAAMKERLLKAYFTEGALVSDREVLVGLGVEVGLEADAVRAVLAGDSQGDALAAGVRADLARAREVGVRGVPFFLLDGKYGVSGAQASDVLLDVLEQVWEKEGHTPAVKVVGLVGAGPGCDGGSCDV